VDEAREGREFLGNPSCFERILVGIDDSEPSDAAITTVLGFSAEDRRRVLFYSVVDIGSISAVHGYGYVSIRNDLYDQAQDVVDQAVALARTQHIVTEGQVTEGDPPGALTAVAREQNADLIVMGSHGRRGLRRFALGSVAESVVRTAPVPVLVVRTLGTVA